MKSSEENLNLGRTLRVLSRRPPFFYLFGLYKKFKQNNAHDGGSPTPSSKHAVIAQYRLKNNIGIFIETGTYLGDMVWACKDLFKEIYSIELDPQLFQAAIRRFKGLTHINILNGDSAKVLSRVTSSVSKPCVFWLDAHHSGGITATAGEQAPIYNELHHIFANWNHQSVILIDDAISFDGTCGYPPMKGVREYVRKYSSKCVVEVKESIIRIHE